VHLSVEGMCSKDLETSSQGVVASKLANAAELLFVTWEQELMVRDIVNKLKEKNCFTFPMGFFSNLEATVTFT